MGGFSLKNKFASAEDIKNDLKLAKNANNNAFVGFPDKTLEDLFKPQAEADKEKLQGDFDFQGSRKRLE